MKNVSAALWMQWVIVSRDCRPGPRNHVRIELAVREALDLEGDEFGASATSRSTPSFIPNEHFGFDRFDIVDDPLALAVGDRNQLCLDTIGVDVDLDPHVVR